MPVSVDLTTYCIGQSRRAGAKAVEEVALLLAAYKASKTTLGDLTNLAQDTNELDQDLEALRSETQSRTEEAFKRYQQKRKMLGVDGRLSLEKLRDSPYLQLRMNAQLLKRRIRDRLRHRKFELEKLE
jgi:hypothetical protein